jgi:hypothetical protein
MVDPVQCHVRATVRTYDNPTHVRRTMSPFQAPKIRKLGSSVVT